MWAKFKDDQLFIGNKRHFYLRDGRGKRVKISEEENHPVWGKRYKIIGYTEWFEENCFEYVKEE